MHSNQKLVDMNTNEFTIQKTTSGATVAYIVSQKNNASDVLADLQAEASNIYYALDTPTYEVLPLADQVALNSLLTFDDTTYLSIESELEPTYLYEYGTSKVGGYALKSLNTAEANTARLNAIETLTSNLASAILE
jgi:hypothetical protein